MPQSSKVKLAFCWIAWSAASNLPSIDSSRFESPQITLLAKRMSDSSCQRITPSRVARNSLLPAVSSRLNGCTLSCEAVLLASDEHHDCHIACQFSGTGWAAIDL